MNFSLQEQYVSLLNLLLKMSRQNASNTEYNLGKKVPFNKRIIDTELSAFGNSSISVKFKVRTFGGPEEEITKIYSCSLTKNDFSNGTISFSAVGISDAETVLDIMYFLTEKLDQMKKNRKEN